MDMETLKTIYDISHEEWQQIILDLGWYALSVSRRLRWRTQNPMDLPVRFCREIRSLGDVSVVHT
jgi:hypothetical protein